MSFRYNIKKNTDTKRYIFFKPTESDNLDHIKVLLEDDDKFDIYPNNEDVDPYNSYKNVKDYIYRIIKNSEFLCKGLSPQYILESFDNVDAVVIIGSSMNILPNGNIFGFALINFDEELNAIYIDVICSHIGIQGAGDMLINEIQYICRKLFMTEIYLISVKDAISFYEKYGFSNIKKLSNNMAIMQKSMRTTKGGKKRKTNKQTKIKKNKKTRKNLRFK